jgi:hypothetical protein
MHISYFKSLKIVMLTIIYFKKAQENSYVIITLYVDDFILAFNDLTLLKDKKIYISKKFETLDLVKTQ